MATSTGRRLRLVAGALVVAVVYAVVGTLSLRLARDTGLAAPVWPAAGVAFAVAFARGWTVLPGIALGSLLVNLPALVNGGSTAAIAISVMIALGAALQAQSGAVAVRRFVGRQPMLAEARQIVLFMALAGPVACLVAPTVGVIAQLLGGVIAPSQALIVWLTWWVGDSIGVVVFAPLTLMLLPEQADVWRGRRFKVAVPSLAISAVTIGAFMQTASLAQAQIILQLDQRAAAAAQALTSNLDRQEAVLASIRSLYDASDDVTRTEFAAFTADALGRFDGLQALSWSPIVPAARLDSFVLDQRRDVAPLDFAAYERDASGETVAVGARDDYAIVQFIEPVETNRAALGYDLQSDEARDAALTAARDSGQVVATAPITLVQETGSQQGILAVLAVYGTGTVPETVSARRSTVEGYATGVYRLGDLLTETFADPAWGGLGLTLVDRTDPDNPVVLSTRAAQDLTMAGPPSMADRATRVDFSVAGRDWALEVRPTEALYSSLGATTQPGLLVGGLLVAGLLEAFLLLVTGHERRARRAAHESGHDATHDELTGLLNRRGFSTSLARARERAADGMPQVLLYIDLDEFKGVNDSAGHKAGDAVLTAIADLLRRHVRERDTVGRIGGDEFAIILNNCGTERGRQIANLLVSVIGSYRLAWDGREYSVGASIGATLITSTSREDAMHAADQALYEAKRAGKGQAHFT